MRVLGMLWRALYKGGLIVGLLLILNGSTPIDDSLSDKVRRFTRPVEFEFVGWTADAAAVRLWTFSSGASGYMAEAERIGLVRSALRLVDEELSLQAELARLYGDPQVDQDGPQIADLQTRLRDVAAREGTLQPLAESILAEQTAVAIDDLGLTIGGVSVPPVAFRMTELPFALIVSPRDEIRQDANIQLETDLPISDQVELEQQVESSLGVSALVVPVGGIGTYPTMIQRSAWIPWVTEVIAHEWTHNFLTPTPLGLNYDRSPELRTMNETTASLMGKEIGRLVLERFYPEDLPEEPTSTGSESAAEPEQPAFDFRAEMRVTRVRVDELLAEGRVRSAEDYMEERRLVFWERGYHIRRLNQAYFAFHGSYADEPGGAAGEDPVGAAVRELWRQSASPAKFLLSIAGMDSQEDLFRAIRAAPEAPIE